MLEGVVLLQPYFSLWYTRCYILRILLDILLVICPPVSLSARVPLPANVPKGSLVPSSDNCEGAVDITSSNTISFESHLCSQVFRFLSIFR